MDFYLNDFKEEVQKRIKEHHSFNHCSFNEEACAVYALRKDTDNCPSVAGELEYIQQLIPILKDMGYIEMRLKYEDSGIWILYWNNHEFNGLTWTLVE